MMTATTKFHELPEKQKFFCHDKPRILFLDDHRLLEFKLQSSQFYCHA